MPVSLPVVNRPNTPPVSAVGPVELVNNKTGTSPTLSTKKRIRYARRKLKRVIREQRRFAKSASLRAVALTLTYRDSTDFLQRHISEFLDRLRRSLKQKGRTLPYAWVLESEGRLHYHLILWLPHNFTLEPARLTKWWPWGSTWIASCRNVGNWTCYMSKCNSVTKLPKRARLFGCGGLDAEGKTNVARAALPRWLVVQLPADHRARRILGVGWADATTGEVYRSPYVWTPRGIKPRGVCSPTCH